jgi:hypothetical protein
LNLRERVRGTWIVPSAGKRYIASTGFKFRKFSRIVEPLYGINQSCFNLGFDFVNTLTGFGTLFLRKFSQGAHHGAEGSFFTDSLGAQLGDSIVRLGATRLLNS